MCAVLSSEIHEMMGKAPQWDYSEYLGAKKIVIITLVAY